MTPPPHTTIAELIRRYDVFFLDAYGVLNDADAALPGAAAFLAALRAAGKQVCVLSNDASHSVDGSWRRCRDWGLEIDADRIITSGLLLADFFAAEGLGGRRCLVLGTPESQDYVRAAGGIVARFDDGDASVLVVADDDGYPFLPSVNAVVTTLLRRMERGQRTTLVLPNPDLVFPLAGGFGITAGAIALMIESVLALRDPSGGQRFVPLGKPFAPIFAAGMQRMGAPDRRRVVMIGDQLVTDIRGARDFGIDSVLVLTGVCRETDLAGATDRPTYLLVDLLG